MFIVSNEIPEGGFITLYFPSNYFNLEQSDPCPIIELNEGLVWNDEVNNPNITKASCSDLFKTSTAQIKDIQRF